MKCHTVTLAVVATCLLLWATASVGFFHKSGGRAQQPAQAETGPDYYAVLNLEDKREDATERDIKQSFRQLSRRYHPDVARTESDKQRYAEINRAYEVLSDRKKRKMYDMRGEEGLMQLERARTAGDRGSDHPLAHLFGFGGGGGSVRGSNGETSVEVDLEDVFSGHSTTIKLVKQMVCKQCKGTGAAKGSPLTQCSLCRGGGVVRQRIQIGPGMYQEMQQMCPHCQGKGRTVKHVCPTCNGKAVVRGSVELNLPIEKGIPEGHRVVFEMEADESPDTVPGDLFVSITTRPHAVFTRRRNGLDLETTLRVTLKEALLGFERGIIHLDRKEQVHVRRTTVTPYGTEIKLPGKGMPKHNVPSERGDLYVKVVFSLPSPLSEEQRHSIEKIL